jgi:hypothetical protein
MTLATRTHRAHRPRWSDDTTTTSAEALFPSGPPLRSVEPRDAMRGSRPTVIRSNAVDIAWSVLKDYSGEVLRGNEYVLVIDSGEDPSFIASFHVTIATEVVPLLVGPGSVALKWREPSAHVPPIRTELGKRLWAIRQQIIASGLPMLDWDGIESEVKTRRGEPE